MGPKRKQRATTDLDMDLYEPDEKYVDFEYKLILVGSAEVGKTSITNRYISDKFDKNQGHSRNVEIQYHQYEIPETNQIARLHLWDTLGQEKFMSIAELFFKGSAGAFVVFDLSRSDTFK